MFQVVLVDDDHQFVRDQKLGCEKLPRRQKQINWSFKGFTEVLAALDWAKRNNDKKILWILDSMMPHGEEISDDDSQEGMITGVCLLAKLLEIDHTRRFKFMMLSNYYIHKLKEEVAKIATASITRVEMKTAVSPAKLVAIIEETLKDWDD